MDKQNLKEALVLVADGSEEIETITVVDVLRRAGVAVTLAGVHGSGVVECSRGVKIVPDAALADVEAHLDRFDVVVLPGGMKGAETFAKSTETHAILRRQLSSGKYVGAVCAAPIALKAANISPGIRLTSHPGVKDQLQNDYAYSEERVVMDDKIITSRGPGSTFEFALKIVEQLVGVDKRNEVAGPLMLPPSLSASAPPEL